MKYLLICGGVGGAKLALGFSKAIDSNSIDIVVNTGDDFNHLGLYVCPDLDTVTYTLSDKVDLKKGWGGSKESWQMLAELDSMGGDTWFQLGDKDLATHIYRTFNLSKGKKLTEVSEENNFKTIFPEINLCSDNAAMIAMVGLEKYKLKQFDKLDYPAKPRWPLDENAKFLKGAGVKL